MTPKSYVDRETGGAVLDRKRDFQDVEDASFLYLGFISFRCKTQNTKR